MSQKYEKPVIIPFNSDGDDVGLGAVTCAAGTGFSLGNCAPGGAASNQCKAGSLAGGNCPGTGNLPNQ